MEEIYNSINSYNGVSGLLNTEVNGFFHSRVICHVIGINVIKKQTKTPQNQNIDHLSWTRINSLGEENKEGMFCKKCSQTLGQTFTVCFSTVDCIKRKVTFQKQ